MAKCKKQNFEFQKVKSKKQIRILLFAFCCLLFVFCFLPFASFSQTVDSINIIVKSTNDAHEKVVLLNDYTARKINLNQFKTARKSAEVALTISENSEFNFGKARALAHLGEIDAKQNNFETAYSRFQESEQIFLKDGDKTDCAELYLIWAKSALLYKKPDDAKKYATSALNFFSNSTNLPYFESELHKILGESWLQKSREGRALGEFDESIKLLVENTAPDSIKSKFTFDIAKLLLDSKNFDDALSNFNAALSIDLKNKDSLNIAFDRFYLAKCHLKLREFSAAKIQIEKSLIFFENKYDSLNAALNHLVYSEILIKEGSKLKAESHLVRSEYLLKSISAKNSSAFAINELSRIYGVVGDTQKQNQYFVKYTSSLENRNPKNGEIFTVDSFYEVEPSNPSFIQKLKSKINTRFLILFLGLGSILSSILLFAKQKRHTSNLASEISNADDFERLKDENLNFDNPNESIEPDVNIENSEIADVETELVNSDLTNENLELNETSASKSELDLGNKDLFDALIESSIKLKTLGLIESPARLFQSDEKFIINTKQQENLEAILKPVLEATLINFEKPITSIKFSRADVDEHSFTLKTIIELPAHSEKERIFQSQLVNSSTENDKSLFNFYISNFKQQLKASNSSAVFANLVHSNYLIIFTEVFDVSE